MDNNYIRFKARYYWDNEENTYYAYIPEMDSVFTDGENIKEIEENLIEIVSLHLAEEEKSELEKVKNLLNNSLDNDDCKENEKILSITFFLPYEFSKIKDIYKKKTLSLPVWLDILATQKNINFSRVLQEGLKKELNIN